MSVLLDTCLLVDLLRASQAADAWIAKIEEPPCLCAVSLLELYAGARSQREEARIEALVAIFRLVPVADAAFRTAGGFVRHYGASHGIDIADALIAATAEHHGLPLATLNVKHFPMFPRLKPAY